LYDPISSARHALTVSSGMQPASQITRLKSSGMPGPFVSHQLLLRSEVVKWSKWRRKILQQIPPRSFFLLTNGLIQIGAKRSSYAVTSTLRCRRSLTWSMRPCETFHLRSCTRALIRNMDLFQNSVLVFMWGMAWRDRNLAIVAICSRFEISTC